MTLITRAELIEEIKRSFAGVTLDGGLSLNQTDALDNFCEGISAKEFAAMPENELTEDWTSIPVSILDEAENIAHLDQKGLKYYLPALMTRLLDNYDAGSMMSVSTLSWLYPKTESKEQSYSELNETQRQTIARFMEGLPELVELGYEHKTIVDRAYKRYWSTYLKATE